MQLTSCAFTHGREIPTRHTCEGPDESPPLEWSGVPANAKSLVLVVEDPDAPDPKAPKRTWCHWIVYGLPAQDGGLPQAVSALPGGAREGLNDSTEVGWSGPCPPIGRHRYFFRLHALDVALPDLGHPNRATMLDAMKGHVIETAELMGTYEQR